MSSMISEFPVPVVAASRGAPFRCGQVVRVVVARCVLVGSILAPAGRARAQVPDGGVAVVSALCADRPSARATAAGRAISATADVVPAEPMRGASAVGRPASDLYCLDLHATAAGRGSIGVVELGKVPTPFGVAVTPDGRHLHELTAWIAGLPAPGELGPFEAFVAWATTPTLDPVVRLGVVGNGRNELGRVSFNKFLILVTAERSADATEREGRLVLRGRSPSSLMEAHDLLAQAPSALQPPPRTDEALGRTDAASWTLPPMYPGMPMLPGIMALEPDGRPYLPDASDLDDLPLARPRQLVRLGDGGTLDLEASLVRREIGGRSLGMFAFNGQHPGPLIEVPEGATIFVNFTNDTPLPTAVHWHGVRLDNRYDGVPGVTQDPVEPGETFRYQIYFRDAGIYWYHPHHREDIQQELGLYGNLLVESPRPDYYSPVNQEQVLMLDDILLSEDGIVPFGEASANYALTGRFGNTLLVNGEPEYVLRAERGEVVRFFLTNVSNTRTFNLSLVRANEPDHVLPMKAVASDVGKYEREVMVESVVLAPAERYVVEVRFDEAGDFTLTNRVQAINHRMGAFFPESTVMGTVVVGEARATEDHGHAFGTLRENADVIAEIDRYRDEFYRPIDLSLVLSLEIRDLPLAVEQSMLYDWVYFNPVEWSGTMPIMNWVTDADKARWVLRDPATGRQNTDIAWRFRVGDLVKIRLYNDRDAFHAMQHPLHIHGQRFLVIQQNGVPNENLVWKDTVLLPTGSTTDILLELSNPGRWMVHCHIAEHLEAGMKLVFEVEP